MENKKKCGAKTKSGKTCQNFPEPGRDRCRFHFGRVKRGAEHHNFKHGLYSRYVSADLKGIIAELEQIDHDDLIDPGHEIRLYMALLISSDTIKNGTNDPEILGQLAMILHRLIHSKQRSQQILLEQQQLVSVTDIQKFLDWLEELLVDKMGSDEAYRLIEKFKTFKLTTGTKK